LKAPICNPRHLQSITIIVNADLTALTTKFTCCHSKLQLNPAGTTWLASSCVTGMSQRKLATKLLGGRRLPGCKASV